MATGIILGTNAYGTIAGHGTYPVINNGSQTLKQGRAVQIAAGAVLYADKDLVNEVEAFLPSDIDPYQSGYIQREGALKLPDWTLVAGTSLLTQGDRYFLDVDGKISNVLPTVGLFQEVGVAIDTNTLDIEIQPSILL